MSWIIRDKMEMDVTKLADKIIAGKEGGQAEGKDCSQFDCRQLIDCDLSLLQKGADRIRAAYRGERVDLCSIFNGRSGRCSENCKYCAQSAHYATDCEIYGLADQEEIISAARENQAEKVGHFAVVTSGRGLTGQEFERVLEAFRRMHSELQIELCASLGFLTEEQFQRLREAGVNRIHNNIETSRRFFPEICTTHTFDDKMDNIRRAQAAGLSVCSGVIIGMGETWEDRIDMALTLSELGILSIPINSLMPIPGTPLENQPRLSEEEIIRTIAIFRYINPRADIRLAGGRALMSGHGRETFRSGASASITGNMLTTSGFTIKSDRAMLRELGRDVTPDWES